jgi:Spy/CpxP family protein refolding chaperone
MTRRMTTTAAAAVLVLSLGALPLAAQGPGQRMGGPGRGGPGGPGAPILPGLNRLDLSEAQRDQLRAIMEQDHQGGDPGEKVRQAEQALHAAVFGETPDPQAIEAAKAALSAAQASGLDHRVELMQKIAQILTPAQRQELARMPGPGGPRGRGAVPSSR